MWSIIALLGYLSKFGHMLAPITVTIIVLAVFGLIFHLRGCNDLCIAAGHGIALGFGIITFCLLSVPVGVILFPIGLLLIPSCLLVAMILPLILSITGPPKTRFGRFGRR